MDKTNNNLFLQSHSSYHFSIFFFFFIFVVLLLEPSRGLPLSTNSRWIVDDANGGSRVKLACVNWVAHLEPALAEGLSKQPLDAISRRIREMGFNCVRLTWPLYLVTNESLASLSVRQSFLRLGLSESLAGLQANNPSIVDLSLINAFKAVVASLTNNKVMVILDNHVSTPGWCCSYSDGNGFFGDKYLDPKVWIQGLTQMTTIFKDNPYVVGISLRNELRGPNQNTANWYRYMQQGAEAVHQANPNVLIILSGLNYDLDLSFLLTKPVNLTFTGKLVFEMHWYGFSDGQAWDNGNANEVCAKVRARNMRMSGFLLDQGYPLFVSEFGTDLMGTNIYRDRYFNCFLGWAAEYDLDWAYWTLVGSYYLREGVVGYDEYYGLMDYNWAQVRNVSFSKRISSIQLPLQGPGLPEFVPHKIIFHPLTGLCIVRRQSQPLKLGNCSESDSWDYTSQKMLKIRGTNFCLKAAQQPDRPVETSASCKVTTTKGVTWDSISDSKLHLAATVGKHRITVCLDVDPDYNIITTNCKCLSGDNSCDPASQWFKLVNASTSVTTATLSDHLAHIISPFLEYLL